MLWISVRSVYTYHGIFIWLNILLFTLNFTVVRSIQWSHRNIAQVPRILHSRAVADSGQKKKSRCSSSLSQASEASSELSNEYRLDSLMERGHLLLHLGAWSALYALLNYIPL
jgi:hypothetical protein